MAANILIVDDDSTLRQVLRDALEGQGYHVREGENGEDGIALALAHKPDLVISDIVMPLVDGWDLCQTLRTMPSTKGTPFVFLTSLDRAPEKFLALKIGADAYLTKPFHADQLTLVVRDLLGRIDMRNTVVTTGDQVSTGEKTENIIVDTIEFLRSTGRQGLVTVQAERESGVVYLASGAVKHVRFGNDEGENALLAMLRCGDSRVSFKEEAHEELGDNFAMGWQDFMASISDRG